MTADGNNEKRRMILQGEFLENESDYQEAAKAFQRELAFQHALNGSPVPIHQFLFYFFRCLGEARLKKCGFLELFRKTKRLPDYRRAEDAVKRGWTHWVELELSVRPDESPLKCLQSLLLHDLHRATPEAHQQILSAQSVTVAASSEAGDTAFLRKLGHALDDQARTSDSTRDFTKVLLHNWLTGFWWLMPPKSVAADFARIQGTPDDTCKQQKFHDNLRKIMTRGKGRPGAYFSAGFNGCFYSTSPPLIHCIEKNGQPQFTNEGRRLLK